ncbi:Peroxiredoxin [Chitinophaga sp. CF118]|uniref:TlpA disulfide reductase family protein n=1 Tax=Chitinophaga sp. CF118 TaxID=1884367 RepID=UPI0008F1562E|nr:TlpA disulfide reductase family protein [Chitinophaga sp. CF118]SFE40873.1 Peroxiredoxin [Chitinophaga sp. CF118]
MKLFTAILLLPALCSASTGPGKGYTIKGTINGITTGTAYLIHEWKDKTITDSVKVKDGSFIFTGITPEPLIYTLKISGVKQQKNFFVENKVMTVQADKDSIYKAVVKGSWENDIFNEFYNVKWKIVTQKAGDIYTRLDVANQKGKVKLDEVTSKAFDQEFLKLDTLNDSVISEFVKQNTGSVAAASIIQDRFINYPYHERAKELLAIMSDKVKQSVYGKQIQASLDLDAKTAIGVVAPDFSMADTTGKAVKLSDLRGKYVLVDFWASWCGPCRKENPNVVKVYKAYHDKGFEILGVSLDSKKEPWEKAINADGLTWMHVSDLKGWKNTAAEMYGVKSVPSSFLLDKDGKVVAKNLRGEALDQKLAEIFNK